MAPYNSYQSRRAAPVQVQESPRKFATLAASLISKYPQKCDLRYTKCPCPWLLTDHRLYQMNLEQWSEQWENENVSILKTSVPSTINMINFILMIMWGTYLEKELNCGSLSLRPSIVFFSSFFLLPLRQGFQFHCADQGSWPNPKATKLHVSQL